jgi:spore coat protein U-like protein
LRLSPFLSLCGIALAVLPLTGRFAAAASATGTLTATITILSSCQTASAGALNLGTPDNHANYIEAQASLIVACTSAIPYIVALDTGPATGGAAPSPVAGGSGTVSYKLFSAGHVAHLGNAEGRDSLADTGAGGVQMLTVQGHISSKASPAAYGDTVRVIIFY